MTVVHAPSPPVAEKFRQFRPEDAADEKAPPAPVQDWPPAVFAQRQGEWAHLQARRSGLHQEQLDRIDRDRSIHPAALPQTGDYVIATGDQLHRLCRERGILYLIYVGFATNICVPDRDYGMRAMRERGYALVLVRDATTGVEASDTYPTLACTSVMIHQFELRDVAGTITSDAFLAACWGFVKRISVHPSTFRHSQDRQDQDERMQTHPTECSSFRSWWALRQAQHMLVEP